VRSSLMVARGVRIALAMLMGSALLASGLLVLVRPASAASTNPAEPAVIGPLLDTDQYLSALGFGEGCDIVGGVITTASGQAKVGSEVSPFIADMDNYCGVFGQESASMAIAGEQAAAPLAAVNPVLDPVIGEIAQEVGMFGTDYASSLAPFGPFVAGMGGALTYFEGSSAYGNAPGT
jgi:hypothetical protein